MEFNKGENRNRYRTLASDIIIFIIGTVLSKAIQFVLMPLYTTYMSTEAYGIAELTNNLSELFFPIATLCIYEAAFRFAVDPEFDNKQLATAVFFVMKKSVIIGFLITIVCSFLFNYKYAFFLFFILYAYSIQMCAAYYVRGCGFSKIFAMSGVINALTLGLFNLIFLVLLKLNEEGYLISIGLSYVCSSIYLVIRGKINKQINKSASNRNDLTVLFKYCFPLIFYNVLYWVTTISGRYVLLWFTDSSTAGKYIAAIKIAAIINMIQQAIYAAFQLNTSRAYTEENREKYYSEITNLFISIYCTFGAMVICLTPLLAIFTLKNDFYEARIYLPIIMLAALINCISSVLGAMYSTYKKTKRMIGVSIVGALINFIIGIILTPQLGVFGVCIASVLCYFSQTIYKFIDIRKFCSITYSWKLVIPNIAILTIQVVIMSIEFHSNLFIAVGLTLFLFTINMKTLSLGTNLLLKKSKFV